MHLCAGRGPSEAPGRPGHDDPQPGHPGRQAVRAGGDCGRRGGHRRTGAGRAHDARRPVRHHRHQRQDDDHHAGGRAVPRDGPPHARRGQHRLSDHRGRGRHDGRRPDGGRGQLLSVRDDQHVPPARRCGAQHHGGSHRASRLDGGVHRHEAPHLRQSDGGGLGGVQLRRSDLP